MESFKLKVEERNTLFYKKYRYKAAVTINGIGRTRYLKSTEQYELDLITYRERDMSPFYKPRTFDFPQIDNYFKWKNENKGKDYTLRLNSNNADFYSNDLALLQSLDSLGTKVTFVEAKAPVHMPNDVKYFKNQPKFKFRISIKGKTLSNHEVQCIDDMIKQYEKTNSIRPSPALKQWAGTQSKYQFRYSHGSFFIDYNEESTLSLMLLMLPDGILGKGYKLEKRPTI